ncbi:MAG: class I tRNA ligase family protein, partial [Simkaniaceae bacterium]|nr:class I tRNA ligase family protein [Simkaniaceae bacterium]
ATIRHRYPFCWRSDTPLIYKAVDTWFIGVEKIKDKIISANNQVNWVPNNIKDGRFGKWLENARDWAVSRNRYWGTPIPIWTSDDGECIVIKSVAELEELTGEKVTDLHRHFIDHLTFEKEGKIFRRVSEVFDCWFESGSMPYAQKHYPFENEKEFTKSFPADFIAEGLDQTRGWFYTLTVLSAALFDKPAFKNVIVNGILLAEDGNKMSKRLKNYPDPMEVVGEYGADAVRLYLLNSPAVHADDLRFSKRGVELVMRQVLIPFWNAYVFFATYAEIYKWDPKDSKDAQCDIDRWILSRLQNLVNDVETGMERYELEKAVSPFVGFIDELTNWYIRRSRGRFWSDEDSSDRKEAFSTLYHVLKEVSKIAAPFVPFIADSIYQELRLDDEPESVHLCDFPEVEKKFVDEILEHEMGAVKKAVSMGHSLRKEHKLKVRQPLACAHIISRDEKALAALGRQKHLVMDELNVKEIEFHSDDSDFVSVVCKPNYPKLGKKLGPKMKELANATKNFGEKEFAAIESGKKISLELDGEKMTFAADEFDMIRSAKVGTVAESDGIITVTLETELTESLLTEGIARELVNKLNTIRRNSGLEVTDRIAVILETTDRVKEAFAVHKDYICHEVLATKVDFTTCDGEEWDLNGELTKIALAKVY